jgi:lipoprotein-releasing system permease protein
MAGSSTNLMRFERYIANKILESKGKLAAFRNPLLRIAVLSIALGMTIMVISVLIVTGFRKQISEKVTGFGAHIEVSGFGNNNSYEESPISSNPPFLDQLKNIREIASVNAYATKAGIIKTSTEIEGIILKGVQQGYNWEFFNDKIVSGRFPEKGEDTKEKELMVSSSIADRLDLEVDDDVIVYFIEQPPRIKKFRITGIYNTGLEELDRLYTYCDISIVQDLNSWNDTLVGGFEIILDDHAKVDAVAQEVYSLAGYQYYTSSIRERYPQIYHWLDLQDINVVIILTLIILVTGVSMISVLLIIVLDNTETIGILKSLGARNRSVKRLFIRISLPVILSGIILGNIIGLGLGWIQMEFELIKLPVESYYIPAVPIHFSLIHIIMLNIGTLVCCMLMLIWPSGIIARIRPARVLRWD